MKNSVQIILWIALILSLNSCSKKDFNLQTLKLPKFNMPNMSNYTLDRKLPMVKNLQYRSSMVEVVLEWIPVQSKEIDGYRIFRFDNTKNSYNLIGTKSYRASSHFVDNSLTPNTIYKYRVSSFTKDGRVSNATNPIIVKTKSTIPPVSGVVAQSNLANRIKISWNIYPKNSLVKKYIIQRSDKSTIWDDIGSVDDSLSVEYFDYKVKSGQPYFYRVVALTHNAIFSPLSNKVQAHSKSLPLAVKDIMATDHIPKKVQLKWSDPNLEKADRQIARYNIYTSLYKDTLYTLHAYTSNLFYTDIVKNDNQKIYYKVTAVDSDGLESLKQKEAKIGSTKANPKRPVINSTLIKDGKIILTWIPGNRNIRNFYVVKKYWDGIIYKKLKITGITSTTFVDSKIKLGKTYKYLVVGVDSDGIDSVQSREVEIKVQ